MNVVPVHQKRLKFSAKTTDPIKAVKTKLKAVLTKEACKVVSEFFKAKLKL